MNVTQKTITLHTNRLSDRHYFECVTKRGLNPEWIAVNCRSMDIKDASDRLGYTANSAGIWLEGFNGFGQFRPNKPWKTEKEKKQKAKAPKYRTATAEEYDIMLPKNPHDPNYWTDLEALKAKCWDMDGHPCLGITEGMFKAIAACSNDIPCVAVAGVEQGLTPAKNDVQGKRYLVDGLDKLAKVGFGFVLLFDADALTNQFVFEAQRKLAAQLVKFKVPVYIGTGLWSVNQGKGMDDYIQKNSAEQFKEEVMKKLVNFATWEKQFKKDEQQELPPKAAAQELAEHYRTQWKHDLTQQTWRRYNGKVWEQIPDKVFEKAIYHDLEAMPSVKYDTYSYIENVVKFLGLELQEREWTSFNRAEWIAFSDCVLEVATGKQHEHSPGFMFTSCLDHKCPDLKFNSGGDALELLRIHAPNFYSWAMYAQSGDPLKVLKLLAIFNGVLTYRFFDLQMFVLLCGVPGSGKGTYVRLLETAVGKQNHASAKMHRLDEDNVIANIIDKQLVVCPDEKKQLGDNSGILILTGGDNIPYRQIYKPQASARFHGALVIAANSNPFVGDTTGIDRRWSLVQFDNPLPIRDSAIEKKMQAEVGVIISLCLSMSDKQVADLITGLGDGAIPDFKRQQWLHKTDNDSIALFMEEVLILAPANHYVMLGGKGDDPSTLYGAYTRMCEENNARNVYTKNNFRNHLLELCREVGWSCVKESRCGNGWRVYGVSIRDTNDSSARISDWLGGGVDQCRQCKPSVDPSVDLKPLLDKDSVGSVDLTEPKISGENHHQPMVAGVTSNPENNALNPTLPTPSAQDKDSGLHSGLHCPTPEPTLTQKIMSNWDDLQALGQIILALADTDQLRQQVQQFTTEQLKHIKEAANIAWKPGCNQTGEYCGEKVELWEFGNNRNWKVRPVSGGNIISAARGNVRPWLGI